MVLFKLRHSAELHVTNFILDLNCIYSEKKINNFIPYNVYTQCIMKYKKTKQIWEKVTDLGGLVYYGKIYQYLNVLVLVGGEYNFLHQVNIWFS